MKRQTTLSNVAERAGVTRSVVSVVLSQRPGTIRVSAATREKVLRAVRETDYRPNLIARGLHAHKSFLLAYLCTGGGSWGVSTRLLRSIQTACRENDYSLAVYISDSLEEERINLKAALSRQVDGIIASPFMNQEETNVEIYRRISADGLPVVQIGQVCPGLSAVARDCEQIGRDAARMLLEAGRRRIVLVTYANYEDPLTGPSSYAEYTGYRQMMREAGLPAAVLPIRIPVRSHDSHVGYKASVMEDASQQISTWLESNPVRPDAFLASSNSLGYAAGFVCREKGWKIPENTAIVSCSDDYTLPSMILPVLSGFPLDAPEIGRAAVDLCLRKTEGKRILIPQSYQENESFVHNQQNTKKRRFP